MAITKSGAAAKTTKPAAASEPATIPMLTKDGLIDLVAGKLATTKAAATPAVDAVLEALGSSLVAGKEVRLHNIGTFKQHMAKARTSRNPRTGEPVSVPARREVRFSVSKALKEAVATA